MIGPCAVSIHPPVEGGSGSSGLIVNGLRSVNEEGEHASYLFCWSEANDKPEMAVSRSDEKHLERHISLIFYNLTVGYIM